jgi:phosphatidylinositol-3-phosphatase
MGKFSQIGPFSLKRLFSSLLLAAMASCANGGETVFRDTAFAQSKMSTNLPLPAHTVIIVLENHAFNQIINSADTPYINQLAKSGALFRQSFGLTHPSQPNYLMLFSGSNQGVTDDNQPQNLPFSTPNLAASLLEHKGTFVGYSEDLPAVGFTGAKSGQYASKHSPWVYWQGQGPNQLPAEVNRPFSDFPKDFNLLPDLAFVIPNLDNDMHNGFTNETVKTGDKWLKDNIDNYVQWAKTHNSLLILTFDEDNYFSGNNIATLFWGPMVKTGIYNEKIGHYNILRTLEEMYNLPYAGESANVAPIIDCWQTSPD